MLNYDLKQFFGWKLLLIMIVFAIAFQVIIMIFDWYYIGEPLAFGVSTISGLVVTYLNLLIVSTAIFKLVSWLNKKLMWSFQTAFLRTVIDVVLFSFVTIGWIILVNFVISYIGRGEPLETKQILYFIALGTIINLFIVPLIEFIVLMNLQFKTELDSKQLLHENTKFRYELLKNQINPHFLFNSLGVLNSLIAESPQKSRTYLNSFSNVLRHVLDFRDYNSIELKDEARFLDDYIHLLNIRFENTFQANIDLPPKY
ncbi:MAG: histidine kinase, partial [Bacteroidota bacterium]